MTTTGDTRSGDDPPGGAPAGGRVPARRRWRLLVPRAPDVVALLIAQGTVSVTGMDAFDAWSHGGGEDSAAAVRTAQHAAADARRQLLAALQAALSTPVDQEDLYVLSERVDRVLTEARYVVREADVLAWTPDTHAGAMGHELASGTREFVTGFALVLKNPAEAGRRADAASEVVRRVEHDYREAMAGLLGVADLRTVLATQDLYRRYLRVAEAIDSVADRLWYSVLRGA